MMKIRHRANINALLSASIWGLVINLVVRNSIGFVPNGIFHKILWDSGTFLALILYPALLSTILHKKTNLWLSVFFFSTLGSALSIWMLFAFDSFQQKAWPTLVVLVLIVWLLSQKAIPTLEGHPTVQKEWGSPLWERLNEFSWSEFLFLRFDFTDYIPVAKPSTTEKKIDAPDEKSCQELVCPSCGQSTSPKLFPAKTSERIKTALVLFLLIYMVASIFLCMLSVPPGLTKHPTWSQPAYAAWLQPLSKTPAFQIIVGSGFVIGFLAFSWDGVQIILGNLRKRRRHLPEKDNSSYKHKCRYCGHQWN